MRDLLLMYEIVTDIHIYYNRLAHFDFFTCVCKCIDNSLFRCDYLYILVHLLRNMMHNLRLNLHLPRFTFATKLKPLVSVNQTYTSQNET